MKGTATPILDPRDREQVVKELLSRSKAYVPELKPSENGPSRGLLEVFGRYMQVIIDRLNRAPDKNLLAFLDMLGISLIPAHAARAPVVFFPSPNALDGRIDAGTTLGAEAPGATEPVRFATEKTIALAAGKLKQVISLWPTRDEYADHSEAASGGRPYTLFESRKPVRHEFYLSHDRLLAFDGKSTVEIEIDLATTGSVALDLAWEYWNGQTWRPFKAFDRWALSASQDRTDGFTRSGIVTLRAECGGSQQTDVLGIEGCWLRCRVNEPLAPDPARVLPTVDRVRIRLAVNRPLRYFKGSCVGDLQPDHALADGSQLDLSKTFFPFGQAPTSDTAFYLSSEEAFSKPGANVRFCFRRVRTPQEEADQEGSDHEVNVNKSRELLLDAARQAAQAVIDAAESVDDLAKKVSNSGALQNLQAKLNDLESVKSNLNTPHDIDDVAKAAAEVLSSMAALLFGVTATEALEFVLGRRQLGTRIRDAGDDAKKATEAAKNALGFLEQLSPVEALLGGGSPKPQLQRPRLAWEYWDGRRWSRLPVQSAKNPEAIHFFGSGVGTGEVSFVIPEDLIPRSVNGVEGYWIRVRVESGSFARLRLVSWVDTKSQKTNFFPIVEPRPPTLEDLFIGYSFRSPFEFPEHSVTFNDFQYELRSGDVRRPGAFFAPFRPVADSTPALYLGLDRPLPNDLVSLLFDVNESAAATPKLVWEAWDGQDFRELTVDDETANLRRPGLVSFIAPGIEPRAEAAISSAEGKRVTTLLRTDAFLFQAGDRLLIREDNKRETAVAEEVQDGFILLETPLTETYAGGSVSLAALPRFGEPLDWIRVRLREDGTPTRSQVNGIFLNAAPALQVETVTNEVLGSGTGQPNQVLFFNQFPILPGEKIEIRELEGPRAEVEYPILKRELLKNGMQEDAIRVESDPRTRRVTEVWVVWQARAHFFFSRPEDRHYVIERSRGRLIFGDGTCGRIPPVGANNVRAQTYRAGGGLSGNVPGGAITQLLSGSLLVEAVTNPRAADGGADGEGVDAVRIRGPRTLVHRGRALSSSDFESLAREASPGVATVRVLPATAPNLRPAPGWVTVIIVPQSLDEEPQPSHELRSQVQAYVAARAPATLRPDRIAVIGPRYLAVGVSAEVIPREVPQAGNVKTRVESAVSRFLHPLTGGPERMGWPFGRDVFLSDLAAIVESVQGVDHARRLQLLLEDTPVGAQVQVPPDRIVSAGSIRIEMKAGE